MRSDDDPLAWEVRVLELAALADLPEDVPRVVYHEITKHLHESTVHVMLLSLVRDVVWSAGLSTPAAVADWIDERKFGLVVEDFDDVGQ